MDVGSSVELALLRVYLCSVKLLMAISGDTLHLHNKNINLESKKEDC